MLKLPAIMFSGLFKLASWTELSTALLLAFPSLSHIPSHNQRGHYTFDNRATLWQVRREGSMSVRPQGNAMFSETQGTRIKLIL